MTDPWDLAAIDSLLTDDERAIRDTVRQFTAEHIRPHIAEWYAAGTLPARELARECGKLGLLGMHLDGYGCAGVGTVAYGLACFELEAADSGVRSLVSVQGSLAMYAIRAFGSEEQRQRWLPAMAAGEAIGCFGLTEPDAGSDPAAMRTRARRDGSDWILTGEKMWITNAGIADVAVVWARTDDGIRGFCVPTDTPGVHTAPVGHKLSLRASVTSSLALQDVRLPADALLPGAISLGAALKCLNEARLGIAFGALGAGYDCLRTVVDYAGTRQAFGRPIAAFQLTQEKLTDMTRGLVTGLLLAIHVGRQAEAGTATPAQVSLAKLNNCQTAIDIARTARTILGANGVTLDYPVLRHANNLESVITYEGTSEVHKLVVGQALTGHSAFR